MSGRQAMRRFSGIVGFLITCSLGAQSPAWAQAADGWSFIITPQVWISHIAKNGFSSGGNLGIPVTDPNGNVIKGFESGNSTGDSLNPQWGLQGAAQKGRWTLGSAFQYVSFETTTDINYAPANGLPIFAPDLNCLGRPNCRPIALNPGDRAAQEFVDTTRMDFDLALSYFIPDVTNWLDLSIGGGFKFIYASSSKVYSNLNPVIAFANAPSPPGLYLVCPEDDILAPGNCTFRQTVKQKSYLYAATIPMSAVFHLTKDSKWLLPFSVTPLLGAETRNDENVVYEVNPDFTVNRQDGTKFAYGVTADATVRWIINETFSAYAGMRVQYIKAHDTYLAYGPLVGMSVRFGGK